MDQWFFFLSVFGRWAFHLDFPLMHEKWFVDETCRRALEKLQLQEAKVLWEKNISSKVATFKNKISLNLSFLFDHLITSPPFFSFSKFVKMIGSVIYFCGTSGRSNALFHPRIHTNSAEKQTFGHQEAQPVWGLFSLLVCWILFFHPLKTLWQTHKRTSKISVNLHQNVGFIDVLPILF